jgi:hypothetical protein
MHRHLVADCVGHAARYRVCAVVNIGAVARDRAPPGIRQALALCHHRHQRVFDVAGCERAGVGRAGKADACRNRVVYAHVKGGIQRGGPFDKYMIAVRVAASGRAVNYAGITGCLRRACIGHGRQHVPASCGPVLYIHVNGRAF